MPPKSVKDLISVLRRLPNVRHLWVHSQATMSATCAGTVVCTCDQFSNASFYNATISVLLMLTLNGGKECDLATRLVE